MEGQQGSVVLSQRALAMAASPVYIRALTGIALVLEQVNYAPWIAIHCLSGQNFVSVQQLLVYSQRT